jgi:ferric-dicitrate binding protein FerR (iron transport regulator)
MNCQAAIDQLDSWIDGALPDDDRAALAAHLEKCPACRAAADSAREQDIALRAAFASCRAASASVAERVAARVVDAPANLQHAEPVQPQRPAPTGGGSTAGWASLFFAAAAGFLIAVMVFRPWEEPQRSVDVALAPRPIAHLALATGPVEVQSPESIQWLACPADASVKPGSRMRTGESMRCELVTAAGSQVRLNTDTEVAWGAQEQSQQEQIELTRGRLWCRVAEGDAPLSVACPQVHVTASNATLDLAAAPDATVVIVLAGEATVDGPHIERTLVGAGRALQLVGGKIERQYRVQNPVVATRWVHELLLQKSEQDPELAARVESLWAQVGRAKMTHLCETEIRSLGDHCVRPLTSYLGSPDSKTEQYRRRTAARIIADCAQPRSIPRLIELLSDSDGEVRYYAAQGLERLTGKNFGRQPEDWKGSWTSCESTHAAWQSWLFKSQDRFPKSGRPAILPKPNEPVALPPSKKVMQPEEGASGKTT